MKKNTIIRASLVLLLAYPILSSILAFSWEAQMGKTGSPGDGTDCRSCHYQDRTAETKEMLFDVISTNIPEDGYVPNEEYEITISGISTPGAIKYGFAMTSENSENEKVGVFDDNGAPGIKAYTKTIGHAPASEDSDPNWTFTWTAPEIGTGVVTFYAAFVISTEGFFNAPVKFSEVSIKEDIGVSVKKINNNEFDLFISNNALNIISNGEVFLKKVTIVNNIGQYITERNLNTFSPENSIDISALNSGLFFVRLATNSGVITKKVMK